MRVNTFSLDFTELPQRINAYEVHEFIDSKLKLQDDQLLSIAIQGNKVYIKVVTQEIVDNILEVYDDKLKFLSQDGKEYKVIIMNKEVDSDSETFKESGQNEVDSEEDPLSMSFSSVTSRPNQEDGKNRKRRNLEKNSDISTSEDERALKTPAMKFLIGINWNELMDADQGPPRGENLSSDTEQGI
ncbi:hypothetical protein JTB14_027666 [Gonioctena quinquepunctata]|nr:hypothetical protein JTB14_027666 [Gonioctena quinquepunctata]